MYYNFVMRIEITKKYNFLQKKQGLSYGDKGKSSEAVDFEEEFTLHNGQLSGTTIAPDWWDFISGTMRLKMVKLPKSPLFDNFQT